MGNGDRTRQRAIQNRTLVRRGKIVDGALHVLARAGVAGLTHRAVATAAGVGVAATTYHFDTKADIVGEASRTLLDGYLTAFRRMAARIAAGEESCLGSLDDLVRRVVLNALGRERVRSLAWCELILHGGRNPEGRALATRWYQELDTIWHDIARLVSPGASRREASAAVDLTIGLTFVLHPLGLDPATAEGLLAGGQDPDPVLAALARPGDGPAEEKGAPSRYAETRQRILQAAIDLIVAEGAGSVSYRRVAEVSNMVRSGPIYYFPSIDGLLESAQIALFERAKARYRAGLASTGAGGIDAGRLLDLTTAIYFREALEFGRENVGYYSVWLSAAQNPSLRPAVASALLDQHRAWLRRIGMTFGWPADPATALRIQALFIGKLIRAISASPDVADLSRAREDFADVLEKRPGTK